MIMGYHWVYQDTVATACNHILGYQNMMIT